MANNRGLERGQIDNNCNVTICLHGELVNFCATSGAALSVNIPAFPLLTGGTFEIRVVKLAVKNFPQSTVNKLVYLTLAGVENVILASASGNARHAPILTTFIGPTDTETLELVEVESEPLIIYIPPAYRTLHLGFTVASDTVINPMLSPTAYFSLTIVLRKLF